MTIQKRTLIEPTDIVALEYECIHCGSRYVVRLKHFDRRVGQCPNCNQQWLTGRSEGGQNDNQTVSLFVEYLKQMQTRNLGVTIRLEIAEPPEEPHRPVTPLQA